MTGIPTVCPACGRPPPGGAEVCPEHQLHAVEPAAAARRDRAPLLGHVFADRYVLIDLLGDGGMGTVYRGIDRRLDRPIAVKVLGAMAMLGEDDRARFEREAQALSRLHSEHTVTVYDYGVATQPALAGTAYIVLELVRGPDLFSRIQDGPLAPAVASSIVADVARSLDEAHRIGIVHRDIKPSNVLLTTTPDGRNIAKVIDFGVARMEDGRRTRTGVMMGTPHYMAPEQCAGGNGRSRVDHRTDLYALGVVLFEMLAGAPPFDGKEPMHILFKQVNDAPPSLPGPSRNKLRKRIEGAIHTAMAKDVDDRQPSVSAFAEEIAAAVAAFPDEARVPLTGGDPSAGPPAVDPSGTLTPFEAPATNPFDHPTRRRWPLVASLVALAAVIGVIGAALLITADRGADAEADAGNEEPVRISVGGGPPDPPPPVVPDIRPDDAGAGAPDGGPAVDAAVDAARRAGPAGRARRATPRRGGTRRARTRRTSPRRPPVRKRPKKPDAQPSDVLIEALPIPLKPKDQ